MVIPVEPASLLTGSGSRPREGSRDTGEGIIVSVEPDMCWTPMGGGMVAVPYRIWARQQDVAAMANSVRQTSLRTHVKESLVLRCYGDEPGTGGGVISGTTGAECTPKTYSATVFAEGRNVARHDDDWWMNHRNTFGRLYYTKDMGQYEEPDPQPVKPMIGSSDDEATLYRATYKSNQDVVDSADGATAGLGTDRSTASTPSKTSKGVQQAFVFPVEPLIGDMLGTGRGPYPSFPFSDGFRTTRRCFFLIVCFDSKAYDKTEYKSQLETQQNAINAKTPEQNVSDIERYDDAYAAKGAAAAAAYNRNNPPLPGMTFPSGNAALHRLDMVAGGRYDDIVGYGDRNINSSIGSSWKGSRVDCLKQYAEDMKASHCPMSVKLDLCNNGCKSYPYTINPNEA